MADSRSGRQEIYKINLGHILCQKQERWQLLRKLCQKPAWQGSQRRSAVYEIAELGLKPRECGFKSQVLNRYSRPPLKQEKLEGRGREEMKTRDQNTGKIAYLTQKHLLNELILLSSLKFFLYFAFTYSSCLKAPFQTLLFPSLLPNFLILKGSRNSDLGTLCRLCPHYTNSLSDSTQPHSFK